MNTSSAWRPALAGLVGLLAMICVSAQTPASRIRGFSAAASTAEATLERTFKTSLSAKEAEADFDVLTKEPHHVGSPYDITLADEIANRFTSFGLDVTRYEYSVLVPWPTERRVDIVAPDTARLDVDEEKLPGDVWAAKPGILPAYNAYSPSGDVTGDVVYVNYGGPADYDTLQQLGISVAGKVVLARYGGGWRGIKPKVAAQHGAIACLIYSDPRDDGYFQGDAYPDGPYRGMGMIQRGSVMDMPTLSGDPSTPGQPSKPGVPRLPLDQIDTLAKIPVQPMSARQGLELLKRLGGPLAPDAWRGALPVTYHIGAGPAKVHVRLQMDYGQRRLINVVARITGSDFPDEWVILGAHHDAWVYGAADPESGQTAVINVARGFGRLLTSGWRPRRSVLIASWDGEEPGLLGSSEWVDDLGAELSAKTVAYVNLDPGATGPYFSTSAVHSLAPFLREVAKSVDADLPGKTLLDRWLNRPRDQALAQPSAPPTVGALGSGSDYSPFLDHLGIAALDLSMNGPGDNGTYHSLYDNPDWFKRYIDPGFQINVRTSQVTGTTILRLANADVLPFDYTAYGQQILDYVSEIEQSATSLWANGARGLDFQNLRRATQAMIRAGAELTAQGEAIANRTPDSTTKATLARVNQRLMLAERALVTPEGLPDRPWFRHVIYAPGLYTGYDVKTMPGIREAVEGKNFERAAEQAQVAIRALDRAAAELAGK
jgi:N-acetylated-alpha-linked acidic dipeptidase